LVLTGECFSVQADAGGSGTISRRYAGQGGSEHFSMKIPNNKVCGSSCVLLLFWVVSFRVICDAC